MTKEQFYNDLKERFGELVKEQGMEQEQLSVSCRALTPEEAIGKTKRTDFPILSGKDVMIQAKFRGVCGQAFTDSPSVYGGTLKDILDMDIVENSHERSIFIAALNAVMAYLGFCKGTVHCRMEGPELCARDMEVYLKINYPEKKHIALIGYQPALLEMLAKSDYQVRVLDLNPANVGQVCYGVLVEDGEKQKEEIKSTYADLILCTGSTICNGSIVDYLDIGPEVVFFGTSAAGAAALLGLKRACFADRYE